MHREDCLERKLHSACCSAPATLQAGKTVFQGGQLLCNTAHRVPQTRLLKLEQRNKLECCCAPALRRRATGAKLLLARPHKTAGSLAISPQRNKTHKERPVAVLW